MNIAIDIDDTLTDSFDYFIPFVAEYFGADAEFLIKNNISHCNLPEAWKDRELDFCKTYFDRVAADTPFKPDAQSAVTRLKSLGHKIIIITGRNDAMYTDPYATTRQELQNGGIPYDKLICTLDKTIACLNERVDLLIDDSISNCAAAHNAGISVLLFTSKWNEKVAAPFRRVSSWQEVLRVIGTDRA